MKFKRIFLITLFIIALGLLLFWKQNNLVTSKPVTQPAKNTVNLSQLSVVSTKPSSLDEATILPNSSIEITLSKQVSLSQFKYHFDPSIPNNIETIGPTSKDGALAFRITFKKPLDLGQGYTLFIDPDTKTNSGTHLDHGYNYHFRTINYSGV